MRWALLVVAVLLAGCGGEDESEPVRTTTVQETRDEAVETVSATSKTLSATLRRAATVLDRESCGDEERIRSLTEEVTAGVRSLDQVKDEPSVAEVRPQIVGSIDQATGVRDELEEILVTC